MEIHGNAFYIQVAHSRITGWVSDSVGGSKYSEKENLKKENIKKNWTRKKKNVLFHKSLGMLALFLIHLKSIVHSPKKKTSHS